MHDHTMVCTRETASHYYFSCCCWWWCCCCCCWWWWWCTHNTQTFIHTYMYSIILSVRRRQSIHAPPTKRWKYSLTHAVGKCQRVCVCVCVFGAVRTPGVPGCVSGRLSVCLDGWMDDLDYLLCTVARRPDELTESLECQRP